jgi:SAM-dependent methyltransferase
MLDRAHVSAGKRVLDAAAGAGEQTIYVARRVGPSGYVLATDLSAGILQFAAEEVKKAGFENVETRVMDAEELTLPAESFDAVISRVGLIYLPDQQKALTGMLRVLKPGGRVGVIVYSTPEKNGFFSLPISIIRRRANLSPSLPGQPGPFSLGATGVLEEALRSAGFEDARSHAIPAPLRMSSAAECVSFQRESFGALHQMLASLPQEEREDVWREIERALGQFEGRSGFEGPCELLVAAATRP